MAVSYDVFQSIIVPRISSRRFRIAPYLVGRLFWPITKQIAFPLERNLRDPILETFAPLAFIGLLFIWFVLLIFGFACMMFALRANISPHINNFSEAIYFAGTSVLTLGFGDLVAKDWTTRLLVLSAAGLGLIYMALQVAYLFAMQTYLQQREQVVNTLTSRAGTPASGLVLLLRYRELNIISSLSTSFVAWENWVASIMESHRAYPMLLYFRSSNRANSWVSTMGACLDAANLISTTIEDVDIGEADLFYWLALGTLKAISDYMELPVDKAAHMSKEEFIEGLELLKSAGFTTKEPERAWMHFAARRSGYMRYLVPLSRSFMTPVCIWMHKLPVMSVNRLAQAPSGEKTSGT